MNLDLINGAFEGLAALFILNHCRVLYNQKSVTGVSVLSTLFFFLWGLWNTHYYPALGQSLSYYAGIAVAAANALWIGLMVYYKYRLILVPEVSPMALPSGVHEYIGEPPNIILTKPKKPKKKKKWPKVSHF